MKILNFNKKKSKKDMAKNLEKDIQNMLKNVDVSMAKYNSLKEKYIHEMEKMIIDFGGFVEDITKNSPKEVNYVLLVPVIDQYFSVLKSAKEMVTTGTIFTEEATNLNSLIEKMKEFEK